MITLATARRLKTAGLTWTPALHDFFAIPDRGLDDRVFVISDVAASVERLNRQLLVTFNGTVEWALDYLLATEAVWLPTEAQLREALERRLAQEPVTDLRLARTLDGYHCTIHFGGRAWNFEAAEASEAYAVALMQVLETAPKTSSS